MQHPSKNLTFHRIHDTVNRYIFRQISSVSEICGRECSITEKRRNSRTSNLKSATTKAKATVKSTVEKIEKTPAAEKTVKAVKKATETVAAKAPEVVEEVKNTVKSHKISGITLEIFETSITVADLEAAVKKDAEAKGLKGKELHIYVNAEERAAYYTADGEGSDDYRIDLTTL